MTLANKHMHIGKLTKIAFDQHDIECNQKYNKTLPYSFHLKLVINQVERFSYLLNNDEHIKTYYGATYHDIIEDARLTFNDVKNIFNKYYDDTFSNEVAEIVIACTERWGHNRDERHSIEYYEYLNKNELAVYVKLCDIIANSLFGLTTNSSMFKKYADEYNKNKKYLYKERFKDVFDFLEKVYEFKK